MSAGKFGGVAVFLVYSCNAIAAEQLLVPQHFWEKLQTDQQTSLNQRYYVIPIEGHKYGSIMDAQTLNQSTPGSNFGSRVGAAYGSAAYVDHAFRGSPRNWNYSATNNVTATIVGALVGSLADQPAKSLFRTRYTIKTGNGNIGYYEEAKPDVFRHSIGLCVTSNPFQPISFDVCNLTFEQFVAKHGLAVPVVLSTRPIMVPVNLPPPEPTEDSAMAAKTTSPSEPAGVAVPRRRGQYEAEVDNVARSENCVAASPPFLGTVSSQYRVYSITCTSGEALAVRCESGKCVALR